MRIPKKHYWFFMILCLAVLLAGCDTVDEKEVQQLPSPKSAAIQEVTPDISMADEEMDIISINIKIGNREYGAKLFNNPTTQALIERMPMTITMGELNGNEKFVYLEEELPTDSEKPGNIKSGDLMLYGSDCMVLFYEGFSTGYSYTRLGYVEDPEGMAEALGQGSVEVSFSAGV